MADTDLLEIGGIAVFFQPVNNQDYILQNTKPNNLLQLAMH